MILNAVSVTGLLLTLSGLAAYNLSQEQSKSVKQGDTVSILCTAENDAHYISWYQQKAGGLPQFLLRNDVRASGLPDRFTFTDSGNQDYLNINGVRAEDEAVYYCACVGCGGATQLISDHASSPPSLLLLTPAGSPLSEGDISVVCVARGFYPDSVTMSWSENSSSMTGDEVQTGPSQRQADGTFSQTSVLKLNKQRWSSGGTYTCRLSHPALSTPLSQSTSLAQCV
ncbi:immunoglobulin lambda-1 light chain [Pangasianodon hypophthalmus]|uniref:immunoglobulin lambda-1 light chain n=1 Tax=Pangasianodon hypophthalmus TaxID=310915 RepID=UPI0023075D76|nr:immunoglobulin lambda-1 light chain [Pangasianodon hypophthalmus]